MDAYALLTYFALKKHINTVDGFFHFLGSVNENLANL